MPPPYPEYVRQTALWLYTRQELSYRQVAQRLGIGASTVQTWVQRFEVQRSRPSANAIEHQQRNPSRHRQIMEAALLREQGYTYKAIAAWMALSQTTVYNYVREAKRLRLLEGRRAWKR